MYVDILTVHNLGRTENIEMLSARYRVPVCAIMRANGIKTAIDFERSSKINIPRQCYCNRCEGEEKTDWKTYMVAPGDTLYSIARRHGVTMNILMKANDLDTPESIRDGDCLKIPVLSGKIYSVREGETIEDIAWQHGMTVRRIREKNGLTADEAVFAGMQLLLD
jgi:LysM repeat protein